MVLHHDRIVCSSCFKFFGFSPVFWNIFFSFTDQLPFTLNWICIFTSRSCEKHDLKRYLVNKTSFSVSNFYQLFQGFPIVLIRNKCWLLVNVCSTDQTRKNFKEILSLGWRFAGFSLQTSLVSSCSVFRQTPQSDVISLIQNRSWFMEAPCRASLRKEADHPLTVCHDYCVTIPAAPHLSTCVYMCVCWGLIVISCGWNLWGSSEMWYFWSLLAYWSEVPLLP